MTLSFRSVCLNAQLGTPFCSTADSSVARLGLEKNGGQNLLAIHDDMNQWPEGTLDALLSPRAESIPQSCPAVSSFRLVSRRLPLRAALYRSLQPQTFSSRPRSRSSNCSSSSRTSSHCVLMKFLCSPFRFLALRAASHDVCLRRTACYCID